MSDLDTIDLLLAHLDDLKIQHAAGINPGPDEIETLFELHADAKRMRADSAITAGLDAYLSPRAVADLMGLESHPPPPAAQLERVRDAVDRVETVVRARRKPRGKAKVA